MFLVFNKQKIYTYLVSIITVILLFCIASSITTNGEDAISASSNLSGGKLLPIYNVKTDEKKVSLTMNCACLQLPMGQN